MSDARERVLAHVRASLKRTGSLPASVTRALDQRLQNPQVNLKPVIPGDPIEHFVEKVRAVNGSVDRVADLAEVSDAVGAHVDRNGLDPVLVVAPDPALDEVPWSNRFAIERRAAVGTDKVSVTGAFAGIAETGTLMLLSGPESPTTLNFLPDDHLIVVKAERIVPHLEDAWARLRAERGKMPRTVNLITGPSKTADVEQTIQEGAHGPRRLHVILVG